MCLAEAVWGLLWPLVGDAASAATATAEQPAVKQVHEQDPHGWGQHYKNAAGGQGIDYERTPA